MKRQASVYTDSSVILTAVYTGLRIYIDSSRVSLIQARVTWEERGSLNSDQTGYDRVGVELSCPLIDV